MAEISRNDIKKQLSFKFQSAVLVLNAHYGNDIEVRKLINTKLSPEIKSSFFSKLQRAHFKKEYLKDVTEIAYKKIFEIIDPFIKENYQLTWNGEKKYIPISIETYDHRLKGLFGTYRAYTWDLENTEAYKVGYIHSFKIQVKSENEIICATQGTNFLTGNMRSLGTEKVALEISHPERKVFIILNIGTAQIDDLKRTKRFQFAYIDSGNSKVKSGLAIIERSDENYNEINPHSQPVADFEKEKDSKFIEFLRGAQFIIP